MLDKIRYRLVYNRTRHLNKKGEALVQVECLLHGQRVFFSTNLYLPPENWEKGFVVNHPHAADLNVYLYRSCSTYRSLNWNSSDVARFLPCSN